MSGIALWIVGVAALVLAIVAIVLLALRKPGNALEGQPGPTGPRGEPGKNGQSQPPVWQSMLLAYKNYLNENGQDPKGGQIVPQRSILVDNTGPYFAAGTLTSRILDNGGLFQTQPLICKETGRYLFTGALFIVFPKHRPDDNKDKYTLAIRWRPSGTRSGSPEFDFVTGVAGTNVGFTQTQLIPTFTVDMTVDDTLLLELSTLPVTSDWDVGAAVLLDIIPGAFESQ